MTPSPNPEEVSEKMVQHDANPAAESDTPPKSYLERAADGYHRGRLFIPAGPPVTPAENAGSSLASSDERREQALWNWQMSVPWNLTAAEEARVCSAFRAGWAARDPNHGLNTK
jgi:hypothetical protein